MHAILQCLCILQSKYTEGCGQRMPIRCPKFLLQVVVIRKMDNLVGFLTHKNIKTKPAGIIEFVFEKQFKNSIFTLNCGGELGPTSLVEVED